MLTKLGELLLLLKTTAEWLPELSWYPDHRVVTLSKKNLLGSFMFSVDDGHATDMNDDPKEFFLEEAPLESEEAVLCHEDLLADYSKYPFRDYVESIAEFDLVGLIESIAKRWPGSYIVFPKEFENLIFIAFNLDKGITNIDRLVLAMAKHIDRWAAARTTT